MWTIWAKALGSKAYNDDENLEIIVGMFIILNAIQNHGLGLIGL